MRERHTESTNKIVIYTYTSTAQVLLITNTASDPFMNIVHLLWTMSFDIVMVFLNIIYNWLSIALNFIST